jgi:DNA-binding transcriptional LysR family regulator
MQKMHYACLMDLTLINDLKLVHETGNFSRAAKLGNSSQPSLSRRIMALETWVGAKLVNRSSRPVSLTCEGMQILNAGLQAAKLIEDERDQIRAALALPEKYVVTFGQQHSISWRFYSDWLQAFQEDYGPVLTRLRADDLPHCMRDLETGDVDFVIAYATRHLGKDDGQGLVIGKDRLVPVCKPNEVGDPIYDFKNPDTIVPVLEFGDDAAISHHLRPMLRENLLSKRLTCIYENSIAGALLIRVRDGSGVAWLPESLIEADLANNILVRTGHDDWIVPLDIRLYFNAQKANALTESIWSFFHKMSPS